MCVTKIIKSWWWWIEIKFTCDECCPYHRVQLVWHLCCSPFASLIHLHELAIEHRWRTVHSCQPSSVQVLAHCIQDAFASKFLRENNKNAYWNHDDSVSVFFFAYYLHSDPMHTESMWLVGYFYVQTNRLFGRFPLQAIRISWGKLGIVEHSPSIGN